MDYESFLAQKTPRDWPSGFAENRWHAVPVGSSRGGGPTSDCRGGVLATCRRCRRRPGALRGHPFPQIAIMPTRIIGDRQDHNRTDAASVVGYAELFRHLLSRCRVRRNDELPSGDLKEPFLELVLHGLFQSRIICRRDQRIEWHWLPRKRLTADQRYIVLLPASRSRICARRRAQKPMARCSQICHNMRVVFHRRKPKWQHHCMCSSRFRYRRAR